MDVKGYDVDVKGYDVEVKGYDVDVMGVMMWTLGYISEQWASRSRRAIGSILHNIYIYIYIYIYKSTYSILERT